MNEKTTATTPTPLTTPTDAGRAREIIESALRDHHACSDCGEAMGIAEHGGKIWIECASLHTRTGLRHAFSSAFHERHRLWLPTGELAAAA